MAEAAINKRNIYVTMREIPDLNGNYMASPVTACYFVDCSPVRWKENNVKKSAWYGYDSYIVSIPFSTYPSKISQHKVK